MRKLFSPLQITVLIVALALTAAFLWLRTPTVEYCDLSENARQYDGKILRIKAQLYLLMHGGYYLSDENCPEGGDRARAAISFLPANSNAIYDALNKFRKSDKLYNDPINLVAVGKFKYQNQLGSSDRIHDRTHLQFEISEIESAER